MKLDIIVTHYNEPYSIVKPAFDMLENQRMVDWNDFRVILVNDGEDCTIPEISQRSFPFSFVELTIPHKGVSAARNAGLDYSDAEWVMFCDCDDMFAGVYALHEIFQVLGDSNHDLLWFPYYVERKGKNDRFIMTIGDLTMIHGKIFRRQFLLDKNLRFCEDLYYAEDMAFIVLVSCEIGKKRTGRINPGMPLYVYTTRAGSVTTNPKNNFRNMVGVFHKQQYMVNELRKRGRDGEAKHYAVRTMTDAYMILCRDDVDIPKAELDVEAQEFYRKNRDDIRSVSKEEIAFLLKSSLDEFRFISNDVHITVPFDKWLDGWVRLHHLDE